MTAENEYKAKEMMLEIQKNNGQIQEFETKIAEIMSIGEFAESQKKIEEVKEKIANTNIEKKEFRNSVLIQLEAPQLIKSLKAMKVVVRSLTKKSAQYRKS